MRRTRCVIITILLALQLLFVGCKGDDPKDFKVGFIYAGTLENQGLALAQDIARQKMESQLGVTTFFADGVQNAQQLTDEVTKMVKKKCSIIFTTSGENAQALIQLAAKYPKVQFIDFGGGAPAGNLGSYQAPLYEASYLSGMTAAAFTSSDRLGFIGAQQDVASLQNVNAFALGALSQNPDAVVKAVWTRSRFDTMLTRQAAEGLWMTGSDVLAGQEALPQVTLESKRNGCLAISWQYNPDPQQFASLCPGGVILDFAPYYIQTVSAGLSGTYTPSAYTGNLANGMVQFVAGPLMDTKPELKAAVEAKLSEIRSGAGNVFSGEIKDQAENIIAEDGQALSADQLGAMNWLASNVEGTLQ